MKDDKLQLLVTFVEVVKKTQATTKKKTTYCSSCRNILQQT